MKKSIIKVLALALVVVMSCALLVACAPASDPAKAQAALEKNDYTVTKLDNEGLGKLAFAAFEIVGIEDATNVVSGTNKDGEHVTIFYFEDAAAANDEWEDVQKYANDEKKEESDWVCKKSGNMIYFGTTAGIKAAK